MRNICELTGFSPTLLRAWERRYDFLSPDRLDGGHRVYDEEDVQVLLRVKQLLAEGYSVGRAAALGREKLLGAGSHPAKDLAGVLTLAPNDLGIHRTTRYGGEELGISLRDLNSAEVGTVVTLYQKVKSIYELWLYTGGQSDGFRTLVRQVEALHDVELLAAVARLGSAGESHPELKRAALEDVKWGALSLLVEMDPEQVNRDPQVLKTVVLLSRDHAKLMRNAFHDLDPILRMADESSKAHGVEGAAKKVHQICPHIEVLLDWDGCYSSRCLETSAVDRVLYDFVRRIKKTGATSATLWVGPSSEGLLRWAFQFEGNDFPKHQTRELATLAVSKSAGITAEAALEMGYLGSKVGWAWFHWPIFRPQPGVKACQCEI